MMDGVKGSFADDEVKVPGKFIDNFEEKSQENNYNTKEWCDNN